MFPNRRKHLIQTTFCVIIFMLSTVSVVAQGEGNWWYFGDSAGIDFNSGSPVVVNNGQLDTEEGCSAISDAAGNLLFYTDGVTVYNRNHVAMLNGTGLLGNSSSANSAVVIPNSANPNIYYIFTTDAVFLPNVGLHYSEVDMSLDGGLGGITSTKNINLENSSTEHLSAIQGTTGGEFWVVSHRVLNNEFVAYKVTGAGVNTVPVVSAVGAVAGTSQGQGILKFSPNGNYLAMTSQMTNQAMALFDFNKTSGIVSNPKVIFDTTPFPFVYGVEFSPNSQVMYVDFEPNVYQYNVSINDDVAIKASELIVNSTSTSGALQLGPDGKIYKTKFVFGADPGSIDVIDNPNVLGSGCNYQVDGLPLAAETQAFFGLPVFIQSTFIQGNINVVDLCLGDATAFTFSETVDSIVWNFGDPASGAANTSILTTPTHVFTGTGSYTITADVIIGGVADSFTQVIEIQPLPTINTVANLHTCDDDTDGIANSFNTSMVQTTLLGGQSDIIITYEDGNGLSLPSPLPNPLSNTIANTETITATLTNNITNCVNTTTFDLIVDPLPIANAVAPLVVCDDDTDGIANFDTSGIQAILLGGQTGLTVTYEDASGTPLPSPLPNPFINTTANAQTITATVTNGITTCDASTMIIFNVLALPTLAMVPDLEECDDAVDGDDDNGFVIFDLTDRATAIINGQANIDLAYFEDAALTMPIGTPTSFYSDDATIFVTLTRNDIPQACSSVNMFDIVAQPLPVFNPGPITLVQCDDDTDGFAPFNLTEAEVLLSPDYLNETFTYTDPSGSPIPDPTLYTNSVPTTEIISVTAETLAGCMRTTTFIIEVDTANITEEYNFYSCDTDGDGIANFDFSSVPAQVTADLGLPLNLVDVTFYENMADAFAEENVIPDISDYDNIPALTAPSIPDPSILVQGIWVRIDGDTANDCQGIGMQVFLNILPNPPLMDVADIVECRDLPGTFTFDLTQRDDDITGGNPNVIVSYYDNLADYNAMPPVPLPTPAAYMTPSSNQTIFYSTAFNMATNGLVCSSFDDTKSFDLIVNPNPTINDIPDYNECAEGTTGTVTLDLSLNNPTIIAGNTEAVTVSYHTSQMGAELGDISVPDPTNYSTTAPLPLVPYTETVWIRVTNDTTDCFSIIDFDINVLISPNVMAPNSYELCDEDNDGFAVFELGTLNPGIFAGDPTLTVEYYFTQSDAINTPPGLALDQTAYPNVLPFNDSVWARVENAGGCETIFEVLLVVLNAPVPNSNPGPYVLCDTDNDGVEIFDLTSREIEILDGLDPTIYDIVWYSDPLFAGDPADIEPASDIADEVNYVSPAVTPLPQVFQVYARVINTTQSPTVRCFEVVTLNLEVQLVPTPDQPTAYELCDDLASGSTTDEVSIFNLRSQDIIIAPSNPNWEVTYYFSEVEAEVGDPATWLADMYPNVVPAAQTIWARVQDTNTGCFATVSVTLVVNPNPSPTTIAPVEVCDLNPNLGDTTADNSGLFDLVDIAVMIQNGESDVTTIFYETEANANDEMSAITTDPYPSISGSIWGRVQNDNTGCFTLVEVELVVNPSPVISDPLPELTACDDDGDTEAVFDLTLNEAAIYGSQAPADFNLTYHETQASAEAPVGDPLDTPIATATLMNYTSATATIWVRLENATTGCTHTGSFAITVAPTPIFAPPPAVWFACDTDDSGSDTDGITTFDLTGITDIITASNADIMVSYYVNAIDIPASPIPTPMAYQGTGADPQTIFMVIESTTAGMCSVQEVIDLRVNALPTLISDPLPNAVACDPDNDGFIDFDLAEYGILILDGQTGITLNFYELEQDAIDNNTTNAIDTALGYNNISGMTTLYVNAESVDNMPDNSLACAKVFSFDLEAHPTPILPDASIDLSITDCDLDGDGVELVDLTVNDAVILAAQDPSFTYILTYHIDDLSAADLSNTGVMDPMNHPVAVGMPPGPTTIFYRILFDDGSECITIGSFEVSVGEFPLIVEPMVPLEVCDDDDDEVALFDLTSIIDDLTLSNPLLNVDFYESQAVIDAGGFAIPEDQLESYPNVSNPQLMQIIVTSLEGCTVQTQLTLRVLPLPSPDNSNPDPIIVCDDDFDGFYTFDTTSVENLLDKADEIDASVATNVEMFESLADAEAYDKVTMLPTPINQSSYTNSIPNGQTIYARVDHNDAVPGNDCYVIVTFNLIINPLPVINPDITDPYVFCEQEDGDDSVGILNLDIIASEIGLLAPPQQEADFNITYHLAQSQAENDAFALTSPYEYTEMPAPNNGLWIRVENKVSGCYVLVFEEIIVEARPVATTPEPMMACEVIEPDPALPNGIPLAGVGEFDLTAQNETINDGPLDADTQVNYFTSEADALSNSNAITDPDIFFNTNNPQTIWAVTQNTLTTCASSPPVFFDISVKATPYTDLSQEGDDICVDPTTAEVLDPITLDATPETVVTGASYSYLWYLNGALFSQDPVIQVTQTGDYTVAVTATYTDITTGMITSCSYLAGANYTPISAPLFEVEVLEDSFSSSGLYTVQVIDSSISGFGPADYEFAIDDGPFQSGLTFTNVSPGDHIVYGRRVDGNCEATPVEVGIIDYPRFFTPNQDGFHDTWNIYGLGSAPNLNAKIFIFDRYGKLLKQLSPTSPGWNGTYNGQPVPSTDYWFRVEFTEPDGENQGNQRTFTGHFALKR